MVQTHAAVLLFLGDRVYKLKKPVNFGFLDFRERADRARMCHRETRCNRRLAPDVYLGVADVVGPDGKLCDHLVMMRRMPDDRRLSALVRQGAPVAAGLDRLARLMAVFHAGAKRGPAIDAEGTRSALRGRWDASFDQLRRFHGGVLDGDAATEVERLAHRFLAGRDLLFAERIRRGAIVDGHGDLIADDVFLLDDGPRVLDCLEFDDRLRYVDVLDDIAFLAMDLEHLGAPEPAARFVDRYLQLSGDVAPAALLHHYTAYRAFVRAKVACLRHEQGDPAAAADVTAYTGLTLHRLRTGTVRMVLVGGPPATGKSTLAGQIADRIGATVLSSDRIRQEVTGTDPRDGDGDGYRLGIHTTEWTEHTYAQMLWRARRLLQRGESVVLDATWNRERHRRCARDLAAGTSSELTELRCTARPATVGARLGGRGPGELSDAGIAAAVARAADAWPESHEVPTDAPVPALTRALTLTGLSAPRERAGQHR
ncbi:AAA family ATPase [Actinoplanes sp. NBRC 101535]|uniref:bifunctional aminoglycoside phosphotransferase/ATP-binding protein n=1 Tax=Actinoplanes sp. NBRC 101535 TaxID=3032196 RepID=UPI0024A28CFA|nr:AAA family ATPase [Actinoplanes sp. NBRC 101535]GLY08738.1 hypothetical protein Acsp01_91170 [Actinoplanes sp. NBRC 101535]